MNHIADMFLDVQVLMLQLHDCVNMQASEHPGMQTDDPGAAVDEGSCLHALVFTDLHEYTIMLTASIPRKQRCKFAGLHGKDRRC